MAASQRYRERHAHHYLAFAERFAPLLIGGEHEPGLLARIAVEHDNLRDASAWAANDPSRAEEALRFADALFWYWYGTGYWYGSGQFRRRASRSRERSRTRRTPIRCSARGRSPPTD